MLAAILIFAGTYLVLALGRLPGFRIDRTGAAIIGASLMIAFNVLTFEQAYAYSLDAAAHWSVPYAARDAADGGWDPALCHHQNGKIFIGDYNDIDSSWQAAHPVWPDSRDGAACKVYAATIERPWFASGWDEAKREAAETGILAKPL